MLEEFDGVIWDGKQARPLSSDEYHHWMHRPLPMGWAIIARPYLRERKSDDHQS